MPYTSLPPRRTAAARGSIPDTPSVYSFDEDIPGRRAPHARFNELHEVVPPAPLERSRQHATLHTAPYNHRRAMQNDSVDPFDAEDSRGFGGSESTLFESRGSRGAPVDSRYSLSSYQYPHGIRPPQGVYTGESPRPRAPQPRRRVSFADDAEASEKASGARREPPQRERRDSSSPLRDGDQRYQSYLHNMIDLALNEYQGNEEGAATSQRGSIASSVSNAPQKRAQLPRLNSMASNASEDQDQFIDADDPRVTGVRRRNMDDPEDIERACLRQMSYKERRKYHSRSKIEFNITSVLNRQMFIIRLAQALMTFGAPSHRIESQLLSAARILEIDAEFIHIPGVIMCSFGDQETKTSELHFVKCAGRLSLGSLHEVHQIYRTVVHDEISAKNAAAQLDALLHAKPVYSALFRTILAFLLSLLICPLAFGGSFVDMWIAGVGAVFLSTMQVRVASKSVLYANVYEITVTTCVSFVARGLSSIRSQVFCYTAISSSSIIGILPGYLILSSSLELASKNIVCGSVKMVYALIYTLFLGFGLQIGSDLYLLFDRSARHELASLAARMTSSVTVSGLFVSDNTTSIASELNRGTINGAFTFTNSTPFIREYIIDGCYRPPEFPWYLQPFPWWTQFIIVPIFSILSSLANLQPIWTLELIVMVVISCIAYAANKVANHFIFNRSDVVSAIGAFAVGLLGNLYSRKFGGTAFTAMVTGVLFLVPSGLSQAGGITAQGDGIDIGGAMIAVAIGITVGLFMSQAIVYMFGSRKNAAVFSF